MDNPGLHNEEDGHDVHEEDPNEGETEGPGQIVLLPIRHEIPAVAKCSEYDEGNCPADC